MVRLISGRFQYISKQFLLLISSTCPSLHQTSTKTTGLLQEFKKGIRQDATLYPVLEYIENWGGWQCGTRGIGQAQNVAEVLEHWYIPLEIIKMENSFDEKWKFMFAVFEGTLQTDKGKDIVCTHDTDYNAQLVFKKICHHAKQPTHASLEGASLLTYLISVKLDDGSWKGITFAFILYWNKQVRLYNKQVTPLDQLSPKIQNSMLENSILPLIEFLQHQISSRLAQNAIWHNSLILTILSTSPVCCYYHLQATLNLN